MYSYKYIIGICPFLIGLFLCVSINGIADLILTPPIFNKFCSVDCEGNIDTPSLKNLATAISGDCDLRGIIRDFYLLYSKRLSSDIRIIKVPIIILIQVLLLLNRTSRHLMVIPICIEVVYLFFSLVLVLPKTPRNDYLEMKAISVYSNLEIITFGCFVWLYQNFQRLPIPTSCIKKIDIDLFFETLMVAMRYEFLPRNANFFKSCIRVMKLSGFVPSRIMKGLFIKVCSVGDSHTLAILLSADVLDFKEMPLEVVNEGVFIMCYRGNYLLVECLLKAVDLADIELFCRNRDRKSPLMAACSNDDIRTDPDRYPKAMITTEEIALQQLETVKVLIAYGADVLYTTTHRESVFSQCAKIGQELITKYLLDVHPPREMIYHALEVAFTNGKVKVARLLLSYTYADEMDPSHHYLWSQYKFESILSKVMSQGSREEAVLLLQEYGNPIIYGYKHPIAQLFDMNSSIDFSHHNHNRTRDLQTVLETQIDIEPFNLQCYIKPNRSRSSYILCCKGAYESRFVKATEAQLLIEAGVKIDYC